MKYYIKEQISVDTQLLNDIKKLCSIICNSPSNTTINGEIESLAFVIEHHPTILNLNKE